MSLNYSDVEDLVEILVKAKANKNTFDCWEQEDVAQEIRIICFNALKHFDSSKVDKDKVINYLGRCVDNRLKNLKRDNYIKYHSREVAAKIEKVKDDPAHPDYAKYKKMCSDLQSKLSIKHPLSFEVVGDNFKKDDEAQERIAIEDLKEYISINIADDKVKEAFWVIVEDYPCKVSKELRAQVQISVLDILGCMA